MTMITKSYFFNNFSDEMDATLAIIDAHLDCFPRFLYENFELRITCKNNPDLIASIEKVLASYV